MSDFDRAFAFTVGIEAGFQNDPRDRGNWTGGEVGKGTCKGTKYGISARYYPNEDIPNLTLDRAKEIAKRDYWDKVCGDDLKWPLNAYLFDARFNGGDAVRDLQTILGVYPDGVVGPVTVDYANRMDAERLAEFLAQRVYEETRMPGWQAYGKGWAKRVILLAQAGVSGE